MIYAGRWGYYADFSSMMQFNTATNKGRPVRHHSGAGSSAGTGAYPPAPGLLGSWSPGKSVVGSLMGAMNIGQPAATSALTKLPWQLTFTPSAADLTDLAALTGWTQLKPGEWESGETDPVMFSELGEDGESVVRLPCHTNGLSCTFNVSTLEAAFATKSCCPVCGTAYGLAGPQPAGTMNAQRMRFDCDGHHGVGTIEIDYTFPSGVQLSQHPSPGQPYTGTSRKAYLPCDADGLKCLGLLVAAFQQGMAFRIGTSVTTGAENTVIWSIHQKTRTDGGPTRHGWPDADYIQRLQSECAAANVKGALSE